MLPSDEYMRSLRREKKEVAIDAEVRNLFLTHRDAMIASFAGLSLQEKLQAFQEVTTLLGAKISGF